MFPNQQKHRLSILSFDAGFDYLTTVLLLFSVRHVPKIGFQDGAEINNSVAEIALHLNS
jgi:hypothetical protein